MSDDDILDSYLANESDLSALYRSTPQNLPSAATDQAILAAAKQSVSSRPQSVSPAMPSKTTPANNTSVPRWLVPASLAATLVLSTSLYLNHQPQWDSAPSLAPSHVPDLAPSGYDTVAKPATRAQAETEASAASLKTHRSDAMRTHPAADMTASPKQARAEKKETARPEASAAERQEIAAEALNSRRSPARLATQATQSAEPLAPSAARLQQPQITPTVASQALQIVPLDYRTSPIRWLQKITQLLADGERFTAQDELDAFRSQHPEYPLPEGLNSLNH
mgnify:CR=1 FL=1